ncbi:MAG TPA: DUF4157 domain-containing protein [Pyrinomonadaceae bacterium]|jgi:outer membrane protein OmpA-like peptidoglycan-associated protein|nr:DUF4157 domain-containing protein [Pyrinomonadaceae bacterium]
MGNERTQAPQHGTHEPADDAKGSPQTKTASPSNDPTSQGLDRSGGSSADDIPLTQRNVLYLQRTLGNRAVVRLLQRKGKLSQPGDAYEQEADRVAERVMTKPNPAAAQRAPRTETLTVVTPLVQRDAAPGEGQSEQGAEQSAGGEDFDADNYLETRLNSIGGGGPLPDHVRAFMEPQFGADFSRVRVHTGGDAAQMNQDLNAQAFTSGQDIYFGEGKTPGIDDVTAHELTHVIQQTGGARTQQISSPVGQVGRKLIQRHLAMSQPAGQGVFEVDMQTRQGAASVPPTKSGMSGTIRFIPNLDAPNSNSIVLVQIFKITDLGGADVNPSTMPGLQAPRGAVGQSGVRTEDDPLRGIEGGFATDVEHQPLAGGAAVPFGSPLSLRYPFGTAGGAAQTPGFKRSNDPVDVRSSILFDFPGATGTGANFDFSFETVARGEDTSIVYGGLKWGFGLRAGVVVNERLSPEDTQTATFDEALARHREFYVHEPVTFYFPFDSDVLPPGEEAKIGEFLDYLTRNTDVELSLEGFADIRGGASQYNLDLSLRRAEAVHAALLARGIPESRINAITIGSGASTAATTDAGTGDQGGNPAVGADQTREANRQFNRRVVLTFTHVPAAAPGGP